MAISTHLTGTGGVQPSSAPTPPPGRSETPPPDRFEAREPASPTRQPANPAAPRPKPTLNAQVFADPGRWESLQEARRQLVELQEGKHPTLRQGEYHIQQHLEASLQQLQYDSTLQQQQLQARTQQVKAQAQADEKQFKGGWKQEQKAHNAQFINTIKAQQAVDAAYPARNGQSTSGQLNRLQELDKMLADPKWASNRATLQQVRNEVAAELARRRVGPGDPLVKRWRQEEALHQELGQFPRTRKEREAWIDQRRQRSEQALTELQEESQQVRSQLESRSKSLQARADQEKVRFREDLTQNLSREVTRLSQVRPDELSPEVRNSQAFSRLKPDKLWVEGDRLVGHSGSGQLEVSSDPQGVTTLKAQTESEKLSSRLTTTPNGGWKEESSLESIPPGALQETVRRDSDGKESRRRVERSAGVEKRSSQEWERGQEVRSSSETLRDGQVTQREERTTRRFDDRVEVFSLREEGAARKSESLVTTYADGSRSRNETVRHQRRTTVKQSLERPDRSSEGSETTTTHASDGSTQKTTLDTKNGKEVRRIQENTQAITPDPDVPGLGWFGSHNPQDLVERLGDEDRLTGERTVRTVTEAGKTTSTEMIRIKSGDGQRELLETKNPNGASVWEYRQKTADGRWDSQIFFQGSSDTLATTNTDENGWKVERTRQDLSTMDAAKSSQIASTTDRTTRVREDARLADVQKALRDSRPPLAAIENSDSFRRFRELAGDGPFKVVAADTQERFQNGKAVDQAHMVIEGPDGHRMIVKFDPDSCAVASQLENVKKPELGIMRSVLTPSGERYEVTPDGKAYHFSSDGQVRHLEGEVWKQADSRYVGKSIGTALKTIPPNLKTSGGLWRAKMGLNFGKVFTGLGALAMGADLLAGDVERAGRRASELGVGSAALIQRAEAVAAARGTSMTGGAWMARAGRSLGAAGVLGGGAFAVYDLAQGEYTHAALGAAATGGSALALWGTASWAGPVGWGAAALATAGTLAYDYNEATRIADFKLPE